MKAFAYLTLTSILLFSSCAEQEKTPLEKLRGMWKLDRFEMKDSLNNNWVAEPSREGYSGYILYDGLGHVAVHLTPKGYKEYDVNKQVDSLSHEELLGRARFYQSNYVYIANASVTDSTVIHNRLSATSPKDWGIVVTRDLEIHNDTLILTTREKIGGIQLRVKWIKMP